MLDVSSLFPNGIRLGVRGGTREKEAVLVAHTVLVNGRREGLTVAPGSRESTRTWMALLEDLKQRGLRDPLLLIPMAEDNGLHDQSQSRRGATRKT